MGVLILVGIIIILGASICIWVLMEHLKPNALPIEKILAILSFLSLAVFLLIMKNHSTAYYKDIDPFVESCYSPISYKHSFGLILLHIFSLISLVIIYLKEYKLPPIQVTVFIVFICIGILINTQFLYQISSHDTSKIHLWNSRNVTNLYLAIYPIIIIFNSIGVLVKMIRNKSNVNLNKKYRNRFLNWLNSKLINSGNMALASIVLTAPILLIIILILTLFGQDIESLTKVYTETATWKLSEHIHPPTVDDRHGHYLCTVAAHGNPKIVKPIGIGNRHGNLIIVNRQLQIANAFEFLIEEINPQIHKLIRENYDKYGLNLAIRINNEVLSNLTYIFMKPLEWFFLIVLYCSYISPEEIINKQYKYDT